MAALQDRQDIMEQSESASSGDEGDNSGSATGTSTSFPDQQSAGEDARRMEIIEQEEKRVRKARYALAAVMIVCACAVTAAVYVSTKNNEYDVFVRKFQVYSTDVIDSAQWQTDYNFRLMQQLSADMTSTALIQNDVFPNLTHPHFDISAGYADGFGGLLSSVYAPIISDLQREEWEDYSQRNTWWIDESEELRVDHPGHLHQTHIHYLKSYVVDQLGKNGKGMNKHNVSEYIFRYVNGSKVREPTREAMPYAPLWQVTPPESDVINVNLFSDGLLYDLYTVMIAMNRTVQSKTTNLANFFDFVLDEGRKDRREHPHTFIAEPVYDVFVKNATVVGILFALAPFDNLFDDILDENAKGVICVVTDNCGSTISYEINGPDVTFIGFGDFHEPRYDEFAHVASLELYESVVDGLCFHKVHVYPSSVFAEDYFTNQPAVFASTVALSFVLMAIVLFVYDQMVTKRQEKTMKSALRSGALVASLFPANVRDRLMDEVDAKHAKHGKDEKKHEMMNNGYAQTSRPIADFFPNTTLMFADISGFTAWASTRDAHQVFELLETIYGALDKVAKKRRIFKVETVGDCYVAICGVPTPRVDHASAMARFATECLSKMKVLTKELEAQLGPDTAALAFRIGLHSGPVTGGVLRGDNARFQLFGDTVNTASRIESTGRPNQIHVSKDTAELLIDASKGHWVTARDDPVNAKGKGLLKTYWLSIKESKTSRSSVSNTNTSSQNDGEEVLSRIEGDSLLEEKSTRLASWNTEILFRYLKLVVANRDKCGCSDQPCDDWAAFSTSYLFDEVVEIIDLPELPKSPEDNNVDSSILEECVRGQLYNFVVSIAHLYPDNAFHNFEHASHVTMSVVKLLGRIAPLADSAIACDDVSLRITSDPLVHFACIFAALIHDVQHPGVPNTQLVKEKTPLAETFQGNSVAEQNSIVVAWNVLMQPQYSSLRRALCTTQEEVKRFRQLVVNAVMATDVMARDLKAIRDRRWVQAFAYDPLQDEESSVTVNRKVTIIIEHLIQASDVCHTMQHWHVYRKWNERLFMEMSVAFAEGRAECNPADTWYQGELGFFDYYIIPLAKKLADCGVFGVSSDEYLNYARKNRDEWEARGEQLVSEMVSKFQNHGNADP